VGGGDDDGPLGDVLSALAESRAAAQVVDAKGRLAWVSEQMLLPARVLALVSEGDEAMFTRMADLSAPAQRPAAVLFADIDGSGPLSRRLPTPVYFELIRGVTTAFDALVARHGGIVGKHAGDGASAYSLRESHGSDAAAALAALRTVQELPDAVAGVVADLADTGVDLRAEDCRMNVGAHWGADLFIGQVVTDGRLEVTALGDEVMTYRLLGDLTDGTDRAAGKAERDAGILAVHDLR
jgi:class 3 adenylate cyclase